MPQDPATLLDHSQCYQCYSTPGIAQLLRLGLLRAIALALNPNATVDPATLLKQASCYQCYIQQSTLLELALLDQIASNLDVDVSGATGVYQGTDDPPTLTPAAAGAIYYKIVPNGYPQKVWLYDNGWKPYSA